MNPNVIDARKGINLRQLDAVLQIWYSRRTSLRGGAVAARRAHNPKVAGSSPAPATLIKRPVHTRSFFYCLHDRRSARCVASPAPVIYLTNSYCSLFYLFAQ